MNHRLKLEIEFRPCRATDLRALEWMGLHTREREIIEATFAAQERGESLMLLALANGYPVAQAWLDFRRRGTPERPRLWAVRVFPALQGAGLGARLMAEAEARAAAAGARQIELGVEWENEAARRFYDRLGYEPAGSETERVRYSFEGYPLEQVLEQQILRKRLTRGVERAPAARLARRGG